MGLCRGEQVDVPDGSGQSKIRVNVKHDIHGMFSVQSAEMMKEKVRISLNACVGWLSAFIFHGAWGGEKGGLAAKTELQRICAVGRRTCPSQLVVRSKPCSSQQSLLIRELFVGKPSSVMLCPFANGLYRC